MLNFPKIGNSDIYTCNRFKSMVHLNIQEYQNVNMSKIKH